MGVPNRFLRHLCSENVGSTKHGNLIVVNFGDFGVVKKWLKWGGQQDSCFLSKFWKLYKIWKNRNVVKTSGGSKICRRQSYNNKCPRFWPYRFPWTRDRIMSKLLRVSSPSDRRRYKGLNNNIFLEAITFNNNNNNHSGPNATGRIFTTSGSISVRASSPTLWGEFLYKEFAV